MIKCYRFFTQSALSLGIFPCCVCVCVSARVCVSKGKEDDYKLPKLSLSFQSLMIEGLCL